MFPIRDDNPTISVPYATYAIIALNVLVWLGLQGLGAPRPLLDSFCGFALIPAKLLALAPDRICYLSPDGRPVTNDDLVEGSDLVVFTLPAQSQ